MTTETASHEGWRQAEETIMSHQHSEHHHEPQNTKDENRSLWATPAGLVFVALLGIGGFFLYTEHRAHLFGALPFLLILACPLLHIFMHGGHGGHGGDKPNASDGSKKS